MADETVVAESEVKVVPRLMKDDPLTEAEQKIIADHDAKGNETRRILCDCGCGGVQGTVSFPKGTSESKWATAMSGYMHPDCHAKMVAARTAEEAAKAAQAEEARKAELASEVAAALEKLGLTKDMLAKLQA